MTQGEARAEIEENISLWTSRLKRLLETSPDEAFEFLVEELVHCFPGANCTELAGYVQGVFLSLPQEL